MMKYKYKSVGNDQTLHKGVIEAVSFDHVVKELNQNGQYVIWARKCRQPQFLKQRAFSNSDISFFSQQLSFLLKSGIPLLTALQTMDTYKATTKKFLFTVCQEILSGKSLSQSLEKTGLFPVFYVRMIKAAEASGGLEEILSLMASRYEQKARRKQTLQNALLYPVFVFCLIFLLLWFSTFFVFPRYQSLFQVLGEDLPKITKAFLGLSECVQNNWPYLFAAMSGLFITDKILQRSVRGYLLKKGKWVLYLPVAGKFLKRHAAVEFSQITGFLLLKGIGIIETLQIASATLQNPYIQKEVVAAAEKIGAGHEIYPVFSQLLFLEPLLLSMVATGQETGRLDKMLLQAAAFYHDWLMHASAKVHGLLEPVLTIMAGIVLGLFALAIMLPSLKMIQTI